MVIYKNKIFLHAPKTGGTFFRRCCQKYGKNINLLDFWSGKNHLNRTVDQGHCDVNNFQLYYKGAAEETHTMMRDPISRFQSIHANFKIHKNVGNLERHKDSKFLQKHVGCVDRFADFLLENPHVIHGRAAIWAAPQFLYMGENTTKYIYESEESWAALFKAFDIDDSKIQLKIKINEPSNELKEKIQIIYRQDCEIYSRLTGLSG